MMKMDYEFRYTKTLKNLSSYTKNTRLNFQLMLVYDIVKYFGFSNILEIGFKEGKTFCALLEAVESGSLTAIDVEFEKQFYDLYYADTEVVINKSVEFLQMSSDDFDADGKEYDFINIDGDHEMPTILNDITKSLSIISRNGIIMIDDYEWKDVDHAIDRMLEMKSDFVPFLMDYQSVFFHHTSHEASEFLDSELKDIFGSFCMVKDVQYKGFHVKKIESLEAVTNHDDVFQLICKKMKL